MDKDVAWPGISEDLERNTDDRWLVAHCGLNWDHSKSNIAAVSSYFNDFLRDFLSDSKLFIHWTTQGGIP